MEEGKLYRAFALQRFAPNPRLQKVIDAAHARMAARELTDDELDFVAAAGAPKPAKKPEEPPK